MTKNIAILGSTGSIGKNTLNVIDALGEDYRVFALSANSSIELLAKQARKYKPDFIAVTDKDYAKQLEKLISDIDCEILVGPNSMVEIASMEQIDIVVTAIVGAAGLPALLHAAKKGKRLAIANKEPLVIAGKLLTETARKNNAEILPIDSEHSAIFQAMLAGTANEVEKVILTSSGGPFRKFSLEQIQNATTEQAMAHPTWNMGPKITVDSATMMNKALEVIEAKWLFNLPAEKIEVLVHPESIVHSFVEFVDGSTIAQLGLPDMRLPIQYALTYPKRVAGAAEHLKLEELGKLTFEMPDLKKFRALALGFEVAKTAGTAAVVFNAANEVAVEQFLAGKIKFVNITEVIELCLEATNVKECGSLEELLEIDAWARKEAYRQRTKI